MYFSNNGLLTQIKQRAGGAFVEAYEPVERKLYVKLRKDAVRPMADYLFNEAGARFLITSGTDRRDALGTFEINHIFAMDEEHGYVCLLAEVHPDDAKIDSITPVVPGAGWSEREFRDVIGVDPVGHPDPRRLVLADDWPEGVHPLRKDLPYDYKPPAAPEARMQFKEAPEGTTVLPIGPFFPVLEEPAQLRLFVDGERVVGCDYRGFYNHRGIEKLGDTVLNYNEIPFLAERICGICGFIHSSCYCQAVEDAAGIEAPIRARYIRTIMLEMERVHSHLLWLGIATHIIGFDTLLMQSWRIREPIMWLSEEISGNRKTYGMNIIGGVRRDIPEEVHPKILAVLDKIEKETLAVADALPGDSTLMLRLRNVGPLTHDHARAMCAVGPTVRGSGHPRDVRVDHPYAAYAEIEPKVCYHDEGDVLARTLVRVEETFESIRQIRKGLADMPDGPIVTPIEDEIPAGREGISMVEAPRGEAIHYVLTGENNRPERWRVRAPTYPNLQCIPAMVQGQEVADVPITLGSIDPCFSCTERVEVVDVNNERKRIYTNDELVALSREKACAERSRRGHRRD
ncbi:MAG: NADH-quinone oxidoreductase subunit C [Armatimonadota bacterium]|nr:MAG: NADH-quinone oxidoreductase subunit C [Armatimonadota bacterium]